MPKYMYNRCIFEYIKTTKYKPLKPYKMKTLKIQTIIKAILITLILASTTYNIIVFGIPN